MPNDSPRPIPIPIPNPIVGRRTTTLSIGSLQELSAKQADVIQRVNSMSNGPALFAIHPIQALQDAGVVVAPAIVQDIWKVLGSPSIPVPKAYTVLRKTTTPPQRMTVTLTSLFTRGAR